jgi:hypothetical protein
MNPTLHDDTFFNILILVLFCYMFVVDDKME